jgi:DNA-binding response OmpR family regulator
LKRILVVDDNRDAADSIATFLGLKGYAAQCAYDGLQAVAQADAFKPEVVLLDINMPGQSGYDVARELRDHKRAPRPLIVGVTGSAQESDKVLAKKLGFDHYLTKPVVLEELLALLRTL